MAVTFFWGEDDFAIAQAVERLKQSVLDPDWTAFNLQIYNGAKEDEAIAGLSEVMSPPFGSGGRLVWLQGVTFCQSCSDRLQKELQRTLPVIPADCHLLVTSPKKPDRRLKSSKCLQEHGKVQEFSPIPPWQTEVLCDRVKQTARTLTVTLEPAAVELLGEAVGNDSRRLWNELEKLKVYQGDRPAPLTPQDIRQLVSATAQNSLQLCAAIREGDTGQALQLLQELLGRNEPALRIVATMIGQFRLWTIIKVMLEAGERDDKAIAKLADLKNPKRLYFLKKELSHLRGTQLQKTLPVLLELEMGLKQGTVAADILTTKTLELCQLFR